MTGWLPVVVPTDSADLTLRDLELVEVAAESLYNLNGAKGYYDPATGRTYLAFHGRGRDLFVTYYVHATDTLATPVLVDSYPITVTDTHGGATIAVASDGRIHIVHGSHNTAHRHAISDSPRDISAWTVTDIHEGTYPQLVVDGDDLLLFDRAGAAHGSTFPAHEYAGVRRYSSGSWGTHTPIIDTTGGPGAASDAYIMSPVLADDGLVHLGWKLTDGASHNVGDTALYHATYDPSDGTMRNAAGTDLGTVITYAEHPDCLVSDPTGTIHKLRVLPMPDGTIHVLYGDSSSGTHKAFIATWAGSSWSVFDTGIASTAGDILPFEGGLVLLLVETGASNSDLNAYFSADGATVTLLGTLIEAGDDAVEMAAVTGGRWLALAGIRPDAASLSATPIDLFPISAVVAPSAPSLHGNERHTKPFAAEDHTHDDLVIDLPNETVFAPGYSVTDGTTLNLDLTFVWGIDGTGDPYYNAAGVTAGDEAVLVLDNATGSLSLRPVEV